MIKRLGKLPSHALKSKDGSSMAAQFVAVNKLRHSAVHRLPTTVKGILGMLQSALDFSGTLRDQVREQRFTDLYVEVESKMKALELNKNFLETRLEEELNEIAMEREKLDLREREAARRAIKEDKEHVALIGSLLSKTVGPIFDPSLNLGEQLEDVQPGNGDQFGLEASDSHEDMPSREDFKTRSQHPNLAEDSTRESTGKLDGELKCACSSEDDADIATLNAMLEAREIEPEHRNSHDSTRSFDGVESFPTIADELKMSYTDTVSPLPFHRAHSDSGKSKASEDDSGSEKGEAVQGNVNVDHE